MLIVLTVISRLLSEALLSLSGLKEPDPTHASFLRFLSEYLPLPPYGVIYIQIPVERLENTSGANLLFGQEEKKRHFYRWRDSHRVDLSSSFNRGAGRHSSLESITDSDCVEVWDSEVSFTSDGPTVQVAPEPHKREIEGAYNADDELSIPDSASDQKIASLEAELNSLKSQLADMLLDKEIKSSIPEPPPNIPTWFTARLSRQTSTPISLTPSTQVQTPMSRLQREEPLFRDRPNMTNVLEGLGSIRLRRVDKSPGGTPLRLAIRSPRPGDDPGSIIAYALKKRFANMLPSFTEDEEISSTEDFDQTFSH